MSLRPADPEIPTHPSNRSNIEGSSFPFGFEFEFEFELFGFSERGTRFPDSWECDAEVRFADCELSEDADQPSCRSSLSTSIGEKLDNVSSRIAFNARRSSEVMLIPLRIPELGGCKLEDPVPDPVPAAAPGPEQPAPDPTPELDSDIDKETLPPGNGLSKLGATDTLTLPLALRTPLVLGINTLGESELPALGPSCELSLFSRSRSCELSGSGGLGGLSTKAGGTTIPDVLGRLETGFSSSVSLSSSITAAGTRLGPLLITLG